MAPRIMSIPSTPTFLAHPILRRIASGIRAMRKRKHTESIDGLGERIRQRRDQLNLSQADLMQRMGGNASRVELSHYENARRVPKAQKLVELAKALDCSVDWLLGLTEKP